MIPPVRVLLYNRWAVFSCPLETQIRLKEILSYQHPRAHFIASYRDGSWNGRVNFFSRSRVATGLFLEMRKEIEEEIPLEVTDLRTFPEFQKIHDSESRPYQKESVEAMIQASNVGGLLINATGSGKTRVAGIFFKRLIGSGIFVCDELALLEQTRRAFQKVLNEEIGIVGRSEFNPCRVTVATIQTLHLHREKALFKRWFKQVGVVIIDEVHIALNHRNLDVISAIKPLAVFGLTATLQVEKPEVKLPAMALCGPIVYEYSLKDGVRQGFLSRGKVICVQFADPLKGIAPGYVTRKRIGGREIEVPIQPGSPTSEYRFHICLNKRRNDLVEKVVREGLRLGRKIIVLVELRAHLAVLDRRFKDIPHRSLSGEVEAEIRLESMREMDSGKLKLILATRVFGRGVDITHVDMLVDATGTPSRNSALQRYGRGARKAEGKINLLFIDVADIGNKFAFAGRLRRKALEETGSRIVSVPWNGNASAIFRR